LRQKVLYGISNRRIIAENTKIFQCII